MILLQGINFNKNPLIKYSLLKKIQLLINEVSLYPNIIDRTKFGHLYYEKY